MRQMMFVLLCVALTFGQSHNSAKPNQQVEEMVKTGTLVVLMSWNDADTTPATGAYVEAHTFDANGVLEKSFILKMIQAGRYEAALPPGVYDVFISEASSSPRCRRVAVNAGYTPTWKLMLEHDDVYLQR
jgi:hypothetical protein